MSKNFSRMIKKNKNTFQSNMAFINKRFDDSDEMFNNENDDYEYDNSNYSMFYDKLNLSKTVENVNNKDDENENNKEYFESNESLEQSQYSDESEIIEKRFIPLKGDDSDYGDLNKNNKNKEDENSLKYSNNIIENSKENIKEIENKEYENESLLEESIKESISNNEINNSFLGHKKKSTKKFSKRNPKCFSKSSSSVLSLIQSNLENIDVDKINDDDLDNLDFNRIKGINIENGSISIEENKVSDSSEVRTKYFSCDNLSKNKLDKDTNSTLIEQNNNISTNLKSSVHSIPKSPSKPAPPPPSYNKIFNNGVEKNTREKKCK